MKGKSGIQGSASGLEGMGGKRLNPGYSGGGLGVFDMEARATDSSNIGVKYFGNYPSVDRTESAKRSSTAPTPSSLGPRKA
jgi:hypothetical protein